MKEYENFLNLEVVWKDEDIIELEVTVTNNGYSGVGQGYTTQEQLKTLVKQLEGYPKDDHPIFYRIGESMLQGHVSISFSPFSPSGLVGVKINLEKEGPADGQHSSVSTQLLVEPNSIDIFQKYLNTLAINQIGVAKLIAR